MKKFIKIGAKILQQSTEWSETVKNILPIQRKKIYNLGACFDVTKLLNTYVMHGSSENLFTVLFLIGNFVTSTGLNRSEFFVGRQKVQHSPSELSTESFLKYASISDETHLREAVKNILVPRVVGTENHTKVREYIVQSLRSLEWKVELHKFHDTVPILGKLHFNNIIAKLNPNAERYLVLACHYDSKYMPDIEFLGATDSAVPCAMLLNLAHVLKEELKSLRDEKLSLMLLFFDGEEAFENWGPTDSIYGARRLADHWEKQKELDRIDMLVLLDLLGTPDPQFYSFFPNTESWYARLIDIEDRLNNAGQLQRYVSSGVLQHDPNRYFQLNALRSSFIEDDHIPFLQRNVPILHMIPVPFPSVWHKEGDNEQIIDYATTENLSRIIRIFTIEYLLRDNEK